MPSLLTLPPELRLYIWSFVFPQGRNIILKFGGCRKRGRLRYLRYCNLLGETHATEFYNDLRATLDLFEINRQLSAEAQEVFFSTNAFYFFRGESVYESLGESQPIKSVLSSDCLLHAKHIGVHIPQAIWQDQGTNDFAQKWLLDVVDIITAENHDKHIRLPLPVLNVLELQFEDMPDWCRAIDYDLTVLQPLSLLKKRPVNEIRVTVSARDGWQEIMKADRLQLQVQDEWQSLIAIDGLSEYLETLVADLMGHT